MPSITPNCAITLYFYEDSARFTYSMDLCSEGWRVQPDGGIHPPSRERVVEIALRGYPDSDLSFAGLQIVSDPRSFPPKSEPWTSVDELTKLGVAVHSPASYPPPKDAAGNQPTPGPLTLEFGPSPSSEPSSPALYYRLAVLLGGTDCLHWDDPKIYNDGSQ